MLLDFSADRTAVSDKMKETVFDLCQGLPLKIINLPKTNTTTTTNKTSGQTSSGGGKKRNDVVKLLKTYESLRYGKRNEMSPDKQKKNKRNRGREDTERTHIEQEDTSKKTKKR